MSPAPRGKLFLKWFMVNAFFVTALAAGAIGYGNRIHGASLFAVPAILLIFFSASALGGRICWLVDRSDLFPSEAIHQAHWLHFWSWGCQIAGIISTMLGFYVILGSGQTDLQSKLAGGKVALLGSLVGVVCSTVLAIEARLIEHEHGG